MIKKTTYEEPEKAISALESELGLRITVIDYEGLFHTIPGQAVLDYNRQSHRKLPSCFIDFCNDKWFTFFSYCFTGNFHYYPFILDKNHLLIFIFVSLSKTLFIKPPFPSEIPITLLGYLILLTITDPLFSICPPEVILIFLLIL